MAGTTSHTMLGGVIAFFMIELVALVLAVIGGSILDLLEGTFYGMGFFDVPPEWDTTAGESMLVNIFYAMPYIIGLLGIFVLIVTCWQRFGRDREEEEEEYNEYRSDQL